MGQYIYAQTGKIINVHTAAGIIPCAEVKYQFKPVIDIWTGWMCRDTPEERRLSGYYKRRIAAWEKMPAMQTVVVVHDNNSMIMYEWMDRDPVQYFLDDSTLGVYLRRLAKVYKPASKYLTLEQLRGDDLIKICGLTGSFKNFNDLIEAKGDYRPTIDCSTPEMKTLADLYDHTQECRNDPRRAYRRATHEKEDTTNEHHHEKLG